MQICLLGSLRVTTVDGRVEITAGQQRVLLARLAVEAGRMVECEQLAMAIWGDPLPAQWRQMLRTLVRRLRVVLGTDGRRIITKSPGYLLDTEPRNVDLWAFDALRREGLAATQDGDWHRVSQALGKAETLRRGMSFADTESAVLREAQRDFEARWLEVRKARLEADVRLCLRSARVAVPDLRQIAASDPVDEHVRWLLTLALYRAGRRADAQTAFRDAWDYYADEFATEPGHALKVLNQRVIDGDRSLLSEPFQDPPAT